LEWIDLSHSNVNDEMIPMLSKLSVRSINLKDTPMSPEGLKELQRRMPNCRIESDD